MNSAEMTEVFTITYKYKGKQIYHKVMKDCPDPRGVKYDLAEYVYNQDSAGCRLDKTGHVVVVDADENVIFEAQNLLALGLFLPSIDHNGNFL